MQFLEFPLLGNNWLLSSQSSAVGFCKEVRHRRLEGYNSQSRLHTTFASSSFRMSPQSLFRTVDIPPRISYSISSTVPQGKCNRLQELLLFLIGRHRSGTSYEVQNQASIAVQGAFYSPLYSATYGPIAYSYYTISTTSSSRLLRRTQRILTSFQPCPASETLMPPSQRAQGLVSLLPSNDRALPQHYEEVISNRVWVSVAN